MLALQPICTTLLRNDGNKFIRKIRRWWMLGLERFKIFRVIHFFCRWWKSQVEILSSYSLYWRYSIWSSTYLFINARSFSIFLRSSVIWLNELMLLWTNRIVTRWAHSISLVSISIEDSSAGHDLIKDKDFYEFLLSSLINNTLVHDLEIFNTNWPAAVEISLEFYQAFWLTKFDFIQLDFFNNDDFRDFDIETWENWLKCWRRFSCVFR